MGSPDLLQAPLTIEFGFNRTTGPVIGAFLTALKDQRVLAIKGADGAVICPPVEYDLATGEPLTEMVEVGSVGTIKSWSWVTTAREGQPLQRPHALALIQLDGADTAMTHIVDAQSDTKIATGDRVQIRWAAEPIGQITDIECFELVEGSATEGAES